MEERKIIDRTLLELNSIKPDWVTDFSEGDLDESLKRIIWFYVIKSPCNKVSTLRKVLTDYGWEEKDYKKNGYLETMLFNIADIEDGVNLFCGNKREDMKKVFSDANMGDSFHDALSENRIAILKNEPCILSIFRHIRNSIAHCRFAIMGEQNDTMVFENGVENRDEFEVKARMIIKKKTLLDWIGSIIDGAKQREIKIEQDNKRIDDAIFDLVQNGKAKSIRLIETMLGIDEVEIGKSIGRLKKSNSIYYDRHMQEWRIRVQGETAA